MNTFIPKLSAEETISKDLSYIITNISILSSALSFYLSEQETHSLVSTILQKTKSSVLAMKEQQDEDYVTQEECISFIEAISALSHIKNVVNDHFINISEIVLTTSLEFFPRFTLWYQNALTNAVKVLIERAQKSFDMTFVWKRISYTTLYMTLEEMQSEEEDASYMRFWNGILVKRGDCCEVLLKGVVGNVLEIVKTLDLSVYEVDGEEKKPVLFLTASGDYNQVLPTNPEHMRLFLDLVRVWSSLELVFGTYDGQLFVESFQVWIDLSTKYPLISGFYKLVTTCLSILSKSNMFRVHTKNTLELIATG
jgi:hypothetical protein